MDILTVATLGPMPTRCRSFVAGVVLAAALAGCASQDSNAPSAPPSPAGPVIQNDVSVAANLGALD